MSVVFVVLVILQLHQVETKLMSKLALTWNEFFFSQFVYLFKCRKNITALSAGQGHLPQLSGIGSAVGSMGSDDASGLMMAMLLSAACRGLSQPLRLLRRRPFFGVPAPPPPSRMETGLLLFPLGKLAKRSKIRRSSCSRSGSTSSPAGYVAGDP